MSAANALTTSKIYRIASRFELPDYVKSAQFDDLAQSYTADYPLWVYADPARKRYPCPDKELTIISLTDYLLDRPQFSPGYRKEIEKRFHKFASLFHIEQDVENLIKQADDEGSQPEIEYGLVTYDPLAGEIKGFPIRNEAEARHAARYLYRHWRDFSYPVRKQTALNILKIASDRGYDLRGERAILERMTGQGPFSIEGFREACKLASHYAEQFAAIYKLENLTKTAAQIRGLADNLEHIHSDDLERCIEALSYPFSLIKSGQFDPPELIIFPVARCELEDALSDLLRLKSGNIYRLSSLFGSIKRASLERYFAPEELRGLDQEILTTKTIKRFAESLDEEQTARLEKLFAAMGIRPVARLAKAVTIP